MIEQVGAVPALIMSSALFAGWHADPGGRSFVYLVGLGMVFGGAALLASRGPGSDINREAAAGGGARGDAGAGVAAALTAHVLYNLVVAGSSVGVGGQGAS